MGSDESAMDERPFVAAVSLYLRTWTLSVSMQLSIRCWSDQAQAYL